MDKSKIYSIWNGAHALPQNWDYPPQERQSVLIAFDQPSRPRFIDYTMLMGGAETPVTKGYVSKGFIQEGFFFVIYAPKDGFKNPTPADLYRMKVPAGVQDDGRRQEYLSIARQMINKYQRVVAHAQRQAALRDAAVEVQDPAKRQAELRAALVAFMAEQQPQTPPAGAEPSAAAPAATPEPAANKAAHAPSPETHVSDKAKAYAALSLEEKLSLLQAEDASAKKTLDALGQKQLRFMPADEREGHFKSIADTRTYLGRVIKEKRRVEALLGISSRAPFRGNRRHSRPLPGRRGPRR